MYVFTIAFFIAILTSSTVTYYRDPSMNVGTVLFSTGDLRKAHWTKSEIGLLRARRYFQDLLPPPHFIDTSNRDYVDKLLQYFKDTYSTIKKEATCSVTDSLMTTAFSDALGGYLKLWILPISKLGFYGGSLSQENILKLYRFHNEIKRFMETDGKGWRKPNSSLLNSIILNIPTSKYFTKTIKNPCQQLAYYENTPQGLSIPIPYVEWAGSASTMFIPLRNVSFIPLDSAYYPNVLFKYYDAAKSCINTSKSKQNDDFEKRFQKWLITDVLPHLSDDHVYFPFGSVLTLMNSSRDICDKDVNLCTKKPKLKCKSQKSCITARIPIDFSSKKTIIVSIILFFEIVWCIPALIYMICKKRRRMCCNNFYALHMNNNGSDKDQGGAKSSKNVSKKNNRFGKNKNKKQLNNLEVETQYFHPEAKASNTGSNFGSGACSVVSVTQVTVPMPPLKSALKKNQKSSTHNVDIKNSVCINPSKSKSNKSNKICSVKEIGKSKSDTPAQSIKTDSFSIDINSDDHSVAFLSAKRASESIETKVNTASNKSSSILINTVASGDITQLKNEIQKDLLLEMDVPPEKKTSLEKKRLLEKDVPSETKVGGRDSDCICDTCLGTKADSAITVLNQGSPKKADPCENVKNNVQFLSPILKHKSKETKKAKNIGLRIDSGRPYLEIKIDKPQTEISVGIGGLLGKRSKIPKRMPKTTVNQMVGCMTPMKKESFIHRKSLIPQLMKRPVDDLAIETSKPKQNSQYKDLNVTL